MTKYSIKPNRLLRHVLQIDIPFNHNSYCAGFELSAWRCDALADHLIEWILDYALKEDELGVNHTNSYVKMKQAAVRVYTSENYKRRGEVGEILLHAICRDFFETIPIAPRVFYLTSSNDVVKSFDMAHVRYLGEGKFELGSRHRISRNPYRTRIPQEREAHHGAANLEGHRTPRGYPGAFREGNID